MGWSLHFDVQSKGKDESATKALRLKQSMGCVKWGEREEEMKGDL